MQHLSSCLVAGREVMSAHVLLGEFFHLGQMQEEDTIRLIQQETKVVRKCDVYVLTSTYKNMWF